MTPATLRVHVCVPPPSGAAAGPNLACRWECVEILYNTMSTKAARGLDNTALLFLLILFASLFVNYRV